MASFFDHPYYKWNKISLESIGIWPEQPFLKRCSLQIFVCVNLWSIIIPENSYKEIVIIMYLFPKSNVNVELFDIALGKLVYVKKTWPNFDVFLEWVPEFGVLLLANIQLLNVSFQRKKFIAMLDHIHSDWERHGDSSNAKVLHKYAAGGRWITKHYFGWMYSACLCYVMMPLVMPMILKTPESVNGTAEPIYLYNADYFVNSDDYRGAILFHMFMESWLCIISIISNDAMYFIFVEHACALFGLVGEGLKRIHINDSMPDDSRDDINYRIICHCIDHHREAIIFTSLIESSYNLCLLAVIGVSLIMLSITGLQVLMHHEEPGQLIRFASFAIAQIFHLYLNSMPGQKILDHSLSIFDHAYSVNWHCLTPKAQKLLILMMIRSLRPCQITAGKIYVITMENYSAVMQTSMSFFTVLSSVQ